MAIDPRPSVFGAGTGERLLGARAQAVARAAGELFGEAVVERLKGRSGRQK